MQRLSLPLAGVLGVALLVSGCASDDGASTTTAPAAASAASGLTEHQQNATTNDPLVIKAIADYRTYAAGQIDDLVRQTKVFTDAVRAGNLQVAQAAYATAREPYERIEPIAELFPDTDKKVDARVDDFANEQDPAFTGFHRLEYLLFKQNTTAGGAPFADQLDADLAALKQNFTTLQIPPATVPVGAAELIEEVSSGKITGEEERYSKTDLWAFDANLDGSKAAIQQLTPALQAKNPALLAKIQAGYTDLDNTLAALRDGQGWKLYCLQNDKFPSQRCPAVTVPPATVNTLKTQLASLSENISTTAGALGLT